MTNAGVVVGWPAISGGTHCGTITSGGNGTVTVTGYGGSLVSPSASQNHFSLGVYVNGSNAMITSGGAGLVTVLGNGGGADANTACGMGVKLFNGTITSGTNGSVVVNGRRGHGLNHSDRHGRRLRHGGLQRRRVPDIKRHDHGHRQWQCDSHRLWRNCRHGKLKSRYYSIIQRYDHIQWWLGFNHRLWRWKWVFGKQSWRCF
jgi:hypothetical protein